MQIFKKMLCLACVLGLTIPAATARGVVAGQSYATFYKYYQEDVSFINDNDNRHLLPLVITRQVSQLEDGRIFYDLLGDILTANIVTRTEDEIIESCVITLTAPDNMEYGGAVYKDFAISGYHSYALLMAMHVDPSAVSRYELVTDVVAGMAAGNGSYTRQVGVYSLTCTRTANTAVLDFRNSRMQEAAPPEEDTPGEAGTGEAAPPDTQDDSGSQDGNGGDEGTGLM